MHPHEHRKMLSTSGAAAYLGVGKSTLDKWRLIGSGPTFCTLGRRIVYDPEDLDTFANARKRTSTSEPLPVAA